MRNILTRKRIVAAAVGTALVVGAGTVFAFWTTSGSGTGSAAAGTNSAVTVHGTTGSLLYPGTSTTVSFTVDNPSAGQQYVTTIHLSSVAAYSVYLGPGNPGNVLAGGCVTTDFTMPDVTADQDFNGTVAGSNTGQAVTATGTLAMADTGANQDACKSAALVLILTSS